MVWFPIGRRDRPAKDPQSPVSYWFAVQPVAPICVSMTWISVCRTPPMLWISSSRPEGMWWGPDPSPELELPRRSTGQPNALPSRGRTGSRPCLRGMVRSGSWCVVIFGARAHYPELRSRTLLLAPRQSVNWNTAKLALRNLFCRLSCIRFGRPRAPG
jgi:hypothetical protein